MEVIGSIHDLNFFDGKVSHSWIWSWSNSVELELRVTVQLDVILISNNYSTNGVALFVESIHALETIIGKQLENNI